MNAKICEPGEISLTLHGRTYSVKGLDWDIDGKDLIREFTGLMVASGFAPSIMVEEGGHWEWVEDDWKWVED